MPAGILVIGLVAALGFTPALPVVPASQEAEPTDTPSLRVSTRLVQVDVIVRDEDGPVDGLSVEDFTVYDDGEPREITTFDVVRTGGRNPEDVAPEPLPPGVITNISRTSGPATGASVLLLDRLNTRTVDQVKVVDQARKFVESLDGNRSLAIYELDRGLRVVQDYTSDPSRLLAALENAGSQVSGQLDSSIGPGASGGFEASGNSVGLDSELLRAQSGGASPFERGNPELDEIVARYFLNDRIRATADALEVIAAAMSDIAGRKSLIWVAGAFPFSFDPGAHFTEAEASGPTRRQLERTARAITEANVAVYPISAIGLLAPEFNQPGRGSRNLAGPLGRTAGVALAEPGAADLRFRRRMSADQVRLDNEPDSSFVMNHIADVTGGEAFYLTNGIAEAIQTSMDDAEIVYSLGFNPDADRLDADFHSLRVVVARDDVEVRHRAGYYGFASAEADGRDREPIVNLVRSPVNATGIELVAVNQLLFGQPDRYVTRLVVNPADLGLEFRDAYWTGAIEVATFAVEPGVTEPEVDVGSVDVRLSETAFETSRKSGYEVFRFVNGLGEPGFLRVVVRSESNGTAGSLWVPLN